jgi:hypothetical protein
LIFVCHEEEIEFIFGVCWSPDHSRQEVYPLQNDLRLVGEDSVDHLKRPAKSADMAYISMTDLLRNIIRAV